MRISIVAAIAIAVVLSACADNGNSYANDDRRFGHFGAGMHAGKTRGN